MITTLDYLLAFCALLCISRLVKYRSHPNYPPGPKGYPIIGNIFDMPKPTERAWERYAEWGIKYSSGIVSVDILGQRLVIINDPNIAIEMLDKKGSIYSGRPKLAMVEMCNFVSRIPFFQYNKMLKSCRKLFARLLGSSKGLEKFSLYEEYQSTMLLKRIMQNPDAFEQAIIKTTGALVLQIAYGYKVTEAGVDPLVHAAEELIYRHAESAKPGRFMVNMFPFLRYVPGWFPLARNFQSFATESRRLIHIAMDDSIKFVQDGMKRGTNPPSFVSELLTELDDKSPSSAERFAQIKCTAGTFYSAGTDTTACSITSYLLAVLIWPEVQQKLQAEIDSIIGQDRMPNFLDRKSGDLPYAEAVVKELARWFNVAVLGFPHRAEADDIQSGYFIPKDATILANIWCFLHDPTVYKDPFTFNPDRFIGPNAERDPYDFAFGFGRRVCPGQKLADLSIWFNVMKLAWAFNITKPKTSDGIVIEPVVEQACSEVG